MVKNIVNHKLNSVIIWYHNFSFMAIKSKRCLRIFNFFVVVETKLNLACVFCVKCVAYNYLLIPYSNHPLDSAL